MIQWKKRRVIIEHDLATFARRYDRAGRYCVCEIKSKYGMGYRVLAMMNERIIGRHRTTSAAIKRLEQIERKELKKRSA